jgi:hypothetical protein
MFGLCEGASMRAIKIGDALHIVTGVCLTADIHRALDGLYPGIMWPFGVMAVIAPIKGEDPTTSPAAKAITAQHPILRGVDASSMPDWSGDEAAAWLQAAAWIRLEVARLGLPEVLDVVEAAMPPESPHQVAP